MRNASAATAVERSAAPVVLRLPGLVVIAFLVGALASFAWSWTPSLWTDEAATISAASRSFDELLAMAQTIDAVHATYYGLMHLWLQVVPADAVWLRLPSAVVTGATTAGLLLVGRRLGGTRTGLLAATVFALLPRTTWMGAEARPYAMTALFALAATGVLVLAVEQQSSAKRSTRRLGGLLAAYAVLAGLGIALNVYVALLLVGHALTLLVHRRVSWSFRGLWLVSGLVATSISAPVVWTAVHQTGQLGGGEFG